MSTQDELLVAVKNKTEERDSRITLSCTAAFELAEQFGVKRMEIGQLCNQHNIRIAHCQLGCFK